MYTLGRGGRSRRLEESFPKGQPEWFLEIFEVINLLLEGAKFGGHCFQHLHHQNLKNIFFIPMPVGIWPSTPPPPEKLSPTSLAAVAERRGLTKRTLGKKEFPRASHFCCFSRLNALPVLWLVCGQNGHPGPKKLEFFKAVMQNLRKCLVT